MTPPRIWDRTLFALEAAYFNWEAMLGRGVITSAQFHKLGQAGRTQEVALRWHVAGRRGNFTLGGERGIGLPTGPFTVWRRVSQLPPKAEPAAVTMAPWGALGYQVGRLAKRLAAAEVSVEADGPSVLFGLADPSDPLSIVAQAAVPAGTGLVWLHGQGIAGVLALANVEVKAVKGVAPEDYHALPGWRPIEVAGLPLGVGPPQGLVGSLVAPRDAALGRLDRGAPPMGWNRRSSPAPPRRPGGRPTASRCSTAWTTSSGSCASCSPRRSRSRPPSARRWSCRRRPRSPASRCPPTPRWPTSPRCRSSRRRWRAICSSASRWATGRRSPSRRRPSPSRARSSGPSTTTWSRRPTRTASTGARRRSTWSPTRRGRRRPRSRPCRPASRPRTSPTRRRRRPTRRGRPARSWAGSARRRPRCSASRATRRRAATTARRAAVR